MNTIAALPVLLTAVLALYPAVGHAGDLVEAARKGQLATVQRLLDQGGDPNAVNPYGECALGWATFNGRTSVVEALLRAGAEVNRKDTLGNAPVLYAAAKGHSEILRLLVDHGADCNVRGRNELTPLMAAARDGHRNAVEALLEGGSHWNAERKGTTALGMARRKGHWPIVQILKDKILPNSKS